MARKITRKNFYMEIRRNFGRFISILFIVALGVAFFSGIRASEPSMRITGDAYFDESDLMDIKAVSTLGITKEESNKDVQCIAVPVKYKENVIAGMSVAVPVFYYSEEFEKKAMEELKKAKQHIEKLIQDNTQEWVYSPLGTET